MIKRAYELTGYGITIETSLRWNSMRSNKPILVYLSIKLF